MSIAWVLGAPFTTTPDGGVGSGITERGGKIVVVGYDWAFTIQAAVSNDGGTTWSTSAPFGTGYAAQAGGAAIDASGNVYVSGNSPTGTPQVAVSTDDGATWTVYSPFGVATIYGGWDVAVSDDGQRIVFTGVSQDFTKQVAVTTDGGTTWTVTGPFGTPQFVGRAVIGPDDKIYVAGYDDSSGNNRAVLAVSDDDGATWVTSFPLGAITGTFNFAFGSDVAVEAGGRVVFTGVSHVGGIYHDSAISHDGGATWGSPLSIFSASGYTAGAACAIKDGVLYVTGTRADNSGALARSDDDGASWQVDDAPFDGGDLALGSFYLAGTPDDQLTQFAVGDDLPPPPPPRIRSYADEPTRVIITDTDTQTLSLLDHRATDRQFLFTLNGPAYHTGQVASDDPEINIPYPNTDSPATLTSNRRLLWAFYRDAFHDPPYREFFGGIVTNMEDQGTDAPTSRYTAYDPWQYMMSRPIRDIDGNLPGPGGLTFPAGTRASAIALQFLQTTDVAEGETHIDFSDTGLQNDTAPLAGPITFDAGLMVGEAWNQLVETATIDIVLIPYYEPTAPGKVVKFATYPQAGSVRNNVVMSWDGPGHSLMGVNRLVDGTRLANRILYFAGQGGSPVPLQSDAASIAANGEYWAQQFFPGTSNAELVELLALAELLIRRNGQRSISLDPAPERTDMVLRDYGLGDYLPAWASRNLREPLAVDYDAHLADPDHPGAAGYHRIYAIPISVDDNGVLRVTGILTSKDTG